MGQRLAERKGQSGATWADAWLAMKHAKERGVSGRAIARSSGIADETVRKWLKRASPGRPPNSESDLDKALSFMEAGRGELGQAAAAPEPTAADALELAGRAVEIEELMSYALHRQRLLRQAMQAAGLSLPAGPRSAAGSGGGR
jgi:transposase-like protein